MRLLILFLVCSIGLGYAADSYAQKAMISIDAHNQRVEDILKEIEEQSDFDFFFNNKHVDLNRRVSVLADKSNIFNVLKRVFAGTNVKFSVLDKKIILSTEMQSSQQEKTIIVSGVVTDVNGEPIIGASILEKGRNGNGTITDLDGKFSLKVQSAKAELEVSYIGYQTQIAKFVAGKTLTIILKEDTKTLDEVVVVGYGTQSKKTLTGAVSMMDMDDIEASTVTTASHALAGKAAGLKVNLQSAQPGGGSKFRIRGEASIAAGNDPLFVVDGFPIGSGNSLGSGTVYNAGTTDNVLESLNPDDIESISVLKDAASTAIYGARAGHGVILITTKRGKNRKASISYSASGSVQSIRANYDIMDKRQFMDMRNKQLYEQYLSKYGLGIYEGYVTPTETPQGFTPQYTNDEIKYGIGTDWLDEVTRTGYMQQHNLSINGGGESMRYMASVNYMKQNGVVKNNGTSRMSARFNFDYDINKYVSVGLTSTYSQNKYDNVPLGDGEQENSGILVAAIRANPATPVYDSNGDYYIDPNRSTAPNPVSLLDIVDKTTKDRILGSAFIVVKPVEGLELKVNLGADRKFQKRSNYLPKTTLEGLRNNGAANISQEDGCDYLMELTATYSKAFKDHILKVLGGYSFQKFTGSGVTAGNTEFLMDGFLYNNLSSGGGAKPSVSSWAWTNSLGSYFARINYMYANRYLFEATVRTDGASNFNPENRWGYFPSVSLGWVMSEEKFMEKTRSWLSNLKWRFSYGQTGNSNIGNYVNSAYAVGRNYVLGGTERKGVYTSKLGNPALTWETTKEFNVGMDLGLFDNRIRLTAEYFNRRITDLLVKEKPLLSYHEVNTIAANSGATQSQGVEVTLNTVNISRKEFSWNSTLTLAHYNDRWLERAADWKPEPYEKADDPIRAWWSYQSMGLLQVGEKAPEAQKDLLPGQVKIKDQNNDGVINSYDRVYMDNGDPKLTFGFNNSLRYKDFDFTIYFYGETGRKRGASYKEDWIRIDNGVNISTFAYKSFSSFNQAATDPSYLSNSYGYGDYYVKSVYYVRCGNITLGYTLPISKKFMQTCRVYANVSNPFVITNWTGLDPETDNGVYSYPNITSYSLGINIKF